MRTINVLLEIGFEEMPSGYILPAVRKFEKSIKDLLKNKKLEFENIKFYSTPRRISFILTELQEKQDDVIIEKIGPSTKIAYTENGELTKAALGFLRSLNASKEDIYIKKTPKGDKIAIKKQFIGEKSSEILTKDLPEIIYGLDFPKSMKWGTNAKPFARPIRWVLALINDKLWDIKLENVKSDKYTYGNRFLGLDKRILIKSISTYLDTLAENYVIADTVARGKTIEEQINRLAKENNLKIAENNNLIDEVNNLVEYPTAVLADFNKRYTELPPKIIISTLSKNQKYFALYNYDGTLSEKFIFISNGNPNYSQIIKIGNQKVVNARLEDAYFYFKEDTKHNPDYFVPKLKEVLFHKKIGTLYEKTLRIVELSKYLCDNLKLDDNRKKAVSRAAYLCKFDLVTLMLGEKEFTKLQGYIGSKYALIAGEPKEVADAIYEHYLPKSKAGELPQTITGALVALADKMDTVCSIFSVNQIPTGSNDPFALRRAAIGIVKIIDFFNLELNIFEFIDKSFSLLKANSNKEKVYEFFKARLNWYLETIGIDYDVINSVTHIDYSNIPDLKKRAIALQNFKENEDFIKLVITFKRVSNIIENFSGEFKIDKSLFQKSIEEDLFKGTEKLKNDIQPLLQEKKYTEIMIRLVKFSPLINKFFDNVLVNTEDEKIKLNRYALLYKIRQIFLIFADLNKLEMKEKNEH